MQNLYGLTPFTLLDFPGHTACVVWFGGCNMRCSFCHNPEMIRAGNNSSYTVAELMSFLESRQDKLDGVVFTGGECTLHPNLPELARMVKDLGFKLKIDSNGLRPQVLRTLLKEDLADYIAVDYKAPPTKFKKVTGVDKYQRFSETVDLLCAQDAVPFEFRTTVHTDLLDEADITWIKNDLNQRGCQAPYYVQNYVHTETPGNMAEQSRILNVSILPPDVELRNFA